MRFVVLTLFAIQIYKYAIITHRDNMCIYLYISISENLITNADGVKQNWNACAHFYCGKYLRVSRFRGESLSRRRNRNDEYFLARTGNPRTTFRARDTKDERGERGSSTRAKLREICRQRGNTLCKGRNMPKKLFSCDVSTEFSRREGTSPITYLDYCARLIGKIVSDERMCGRIIVCH